MRILAIETSCDETCASVTDGTEVLSNVVWSQIDLHREFGGVVPSIAKRAHEEKITQVVDLAMTKSQIPNPKIDAIAVTVGPGLAIALEVGVRKAKELAKKWSRPLVAVNHIEGHVLSPLARASHKSQISSSKQLQGSKFKIQNLKFPAMGMVVSGGHTELILIRAIGDYEIVARTVDDALGESLDKAARILGLGYPGGAELEKRARGGNPKAYPLPLPMAGRENQGEFSYSGLKTAFYRLVSKIETENRDRGVKGTSFAHDLLNTGPVASCPSRQCSRDLPVCALSGPLPLAPPVLSVGAKLANGLADEQIRDLAATYQGRAFEHLLRITKKALEKYPVRDMLVGGGVAINDDLRFRIYDLGIKLDMNVWFPPKRLYGDNAAMIGIAAGFKLERGEVEKEVEKVDREPRARVDKKFAWHDMEVITK